MVTVPFGRMYGESMLRVWVTLIRAKKRPRDECPPSVFKRAREIRRLAGR